MVLADTSKGDIGWKKWLVTGWAIVEVFLFGGVLFGWGSLVFILKNDGIYADLCTRDLIDDFTNGTTVTHRKDEICEDQDSKMTLCFTIASALYCVGGSIFGHISYKCGTRLTRILSFLFFITGSLMMSFISKDNPWLMFPGMSFLGVGGLPVFVTNIQVSNLFLTGSSSVVGLISGAMDSSAAVMMIVKIAVEKGFSRQNMFLILTALHSLILISTFFFLPRTFVMKPLEFNKSTLATMETNIQVERNREDGQTDKHTNPNEQPLNSTKKPTLIECLKTPMFITHVIWMCLLQLRFFIFIGTLNQFLNRVVSNDKELVSYFTNICYSIMIGGLFTSFLSGIMYDWQKKMCKDGKSARYREVMPAVLPLATASLLGIILSILVLIPGQAVLYVTFIIMTMYISFLYSLFAGFLSALFPTEKFGLLYGIAYMCGGLFGLLQYGFFKWTEAYTDGTLHTNIFLLFMVLLSLLHPIFLWISCWKDERKFKTYEITNGQ